MDCSHAQLHIITRGALAYLADAAQAVGDDITLTVTLIAPLPVRVLLIDLGTRAFHSDDVAAHADYLVLITHLVVAVRTRSLYDVLVLVSKSPHHHIGGSGSALLYVLRMHDQVTVFDHDTLIVHFVLVSRLVLLPSDVLLTAHHINVLLRLLALEIVDPYFSAIVFGLVLDL